MQRLEGIDIEYKREYTPNVIRTVIAFANTAGGCVKIGVADDRSVVGVNDIENERLAISEAVRQNIKPDISMFVKYEIETIEDKLIFVISVQRGTSRPYYLNGKGLRPEGVFVRSDASTVQASELAIREMIRESDGDSYEVLRSFNQDLTFDYAEKEFNKRKVLFGESQKRTLFITNSENKYTNVGLLISDQCPFTTKLAVFEGTSKSVFRDSKELYGSLLKQLNDAFEYIDGFNKTRAEFKGLERVENRDYPVIAIREALVNAFVHREYSVAASTQISIFDDRLELLSIGGLANGLSYDAMMAGVSVSRNPNLVAIFRILRLIEAYGTGISRIIDSYSANPKKPEIKTTDTSFKTILPNTNHESKAFFKIALLTDKKYDVMALFETRVLLTRKDVESALQVSQSTAVNLLKELLELKLIEKIGSGKNIKYRAIT